VQASSNGGTLVGLQQWRRQRLEQTRDKVIVLIYSACGIFHLAGYSLRLGVNIKDRPRGVGIPQELLAKYELPMRG
jgi:hypothetical protein